MRRITQVTLAGLVLLAGVLSARAQDDEARAIIDKATAAHGGAKALAKHSASQAKAAGSLDIMGMSAKFSGDFYHQLPDKLKFVMDLSVNNMNIAVTQVFDGKKAWVHVMGKTMELEDAKLIQEFKEAMHGERILLLYPLADKKFKLSPLGEVKVNDQDAVGVRVSHDGFRDASLYFDKKTHLVLKMERRAIHPNTMQELDEAKLFSDYKDVQGVKTPMKMTVHHDGQKYLELEMSEVRLLERLDDEIFAKP